MKFRLVEDLQNNIFYRVTRGQDLEQFSCEYPEFFTQSLNYALEYAEPEEQPIIYTVQLDINLPFGQFDARQLEIYNTEYIPWAGAHQEFFSPGISQQDLINILQPKKLNDKLDLVNADCIYHFLKEHDFGYDGLIVDEGITGGKFNGICAFVPFYTTQINIINKQEYSEECGQIKKK